MDDAMPNRLVAIDFETANASLGSICQAGIVVFQGGQIVDEWKSLVDPEEWFDPMNISIHGIDEETVQGAPTLPTIFPVLEQRMRDHTVVCHTHFDRVSMTQAAAKYQLPPFTCAWLDSAMVARRCWTQFSRTGYGLANLCDCFGIRYAAHDALEDARAAGLLMMRAMAESGLGVEEWLARVRQPIGPLGGGAPLIAQDGNPAGCLYGEEIVFTGALTMRRVDAAAYAARLGCCVATSIRKTTTLLVVGDQDVTRLAGYQKSAKHRAAEAAIAKSQPIRILREADFLELLTIEDGRGAGTALAE